MIVTGAVPSTLPEASKLVAVAAAKDGAPVKVGEARAALAFNCVWIELVGSTNAKVAGVTPSTVLLVVVCVSVVPRIVPVGNVGKPVISVDAIDLLVSVCVSVVPTIAPVGAVKDVNHAVPLDTAIPAPGYTCVVVMLLQPHTCVVVL